MAARLGCVPYNQQHGNGNSRRTLELGLYGQRTASSNCSGLVGSGAGFAYTGARAAELATIHSYTTAFFWAGVVIATGAALTAAILRGDVPEVDENATELPAL